MGGVWMALLLGFAAPAGASMMKSCGDEAEIEWAKARKAKDPRRRAAAHQKLVCKCWHPNADCDDPEGVRKLALEHWLAGARHYQNGEDAKAHEEWRACAALDPASEDCRKGLETLERVRAEPPAQKGWPPKRVKKAGGKEAALRHWHAGIEHFQKGSYEKAQNEWLLCKKLDPTNQDCQTGLQRLDSTYGGP